MVQYFPYFLHYLPCTRKDKTLPVNNHQRIDCVIRAIIYFLITHESRQLHELWRNWKSEFRPLSIFMEINITETKDMLGNYYVKNLFTEYRYGRTIETAFETIEKIRKGSWKQARSWELLAYLSHGPMVSIFDDRLSMRGGFAKWVLYLLTIDHKRNLTKSSMNCLAFFNRNPGEFHHDRQTMDSPQHTEGQVAVQTVHFSESKEVKVGWSVNKLMVTLFGVWGLGDLQLMMNI